MCNHIRQVQTDLQRKHGDMNLGEKNWPQLSSPFHPHNPRKSDLKGEKSKEPPACPQRATRPWLFPRYSSLLARLCLHPCQANCPSCGACGMQKPPSNNQDFFAELRGSFRGSFVQTSHGSGGFCHLGSKVQLSQGRKALKGNCCPQHRARKFN